MKPILLGQPCQARNVHAGVIVNDKGREWFVITNMNEASNMELIMIDAQRDVAEVHRAPAGSGAWALEKLSETLLAVGTYFDGMFMLFDVAKRQWAKTAKFPGEDYIWNFGIGKDGRLYGGTYPGGKLGALTVETSAVEDLGAPTKASGNLYLRYVSALPDGRLFCQFGFGKPETQVFDPATKAFTKAPDALQSASIGVTWNGYFLVGAKAFRMPDLAEVTPLPFPEPDPKDGAWNVDTRLTDSKTLILRQGQKVWRFVAGEKKLTLALTLTENSGGLLARNDKGTFFGVRGQDYFTLFTLGGRKRKLELKRIPGPAAPRPTHFLRVDDRGRLWGGPTFGQTLFYLDTKTGKLTNTRTISDQGGEVYDAAILDGICYAVAYVGGEVIRFDPDAKWNQVEHVNPKTIFRVGPDYIRPSAGVCVGDDGRLYAGWLAKYGEYGGAVSITDPKTGKSDVLKNPLGPQGISGVAPVGVGQVLIGTSTEANGLSAQKGVPVKVGLWDLAQGKALWTHEFPDVASVYGLLYDSHTKLAACAYRNKLYVFDPQKGELGAPAIEKLSSSPILGEPGTVLYADGNTLLSYSLTTKESRELAKLPAKIGSIAYGGPEKRVFVACGVDVYSLQ